MASSSVRPFVISGAASAVRTTPVHVCARVRSYTHTTHKSAD